MHIARFVGCASLALEARSNVDASVLGFELLGALHGTLLRSRAGCKGHKAAAGGAVRRGMRFLQGVAGVETAGCVRERSLDHRTLEGASGVRNRHVPPT